MELRVEGRGVSSNQINNKRKVRKRKIKKIK